MLTTDYDATYRAIEETEADYFDIISDFGVVVPIPEVLTASLYRADVHTKYFIHEDPPDSTKQLVPGTASPMIAQEQTAPAHKDKLSNLGPPGK